MEVHLWLAEEANGGRNEVGSGVVVTVVLYTVVQAVDERFR